MKKHSILLITGMTALLNMGLASADADCGSCHGKDGISTNEEVPSIAGMSATYIKDSFDAYKEGDRPGIKFKDKDGNENDMASIAKKISDEELEEEADEFSKLTFKNFPQTADDSKVAAGKKKFKKKCDKCHAEGGTDPEDDAGLLSGQPRKYLETQFANFSAHDRAMPKKMKKKFKKLSDADKANIIEYLVKGQ